MLEILGTFVVYLIAFAVGSVAALLVARRFYPATSEREALAEVEGTLDPRGAGR